jgi:hypothetical protein
MRSFNHHPRIEFAAELLRIICGTLGLSLLFFLSAAPILGRQAQSVEPEELQKLIKTGQKVKLVLRNGTYGEGKVHEVDQHMLDLEIKKTNDPKELATGRQQVRLERVASVTFTAYKGNTRIWLAAILPATIGTAALIAAEASEKPSTYRPIAIPFTVGLGVGGYLGGRALDRKEIMVTIKQEAIDPSRSPD